MQGLTKLREIQVGGDIKQYMFQFISPEKQFYEVPSSDGGPPRQFGQVRGDSADS